MPNFKVVIDYTGQTTFKVEADDPTEAGEIVREFFEKGLETSRKIPESVTEDPENPDNPDFVVEDDECEEEVVEVVTISRFIGDLEREEARQKIYKAYGTEDEDEIYAKAAAKRVGTAHVESLIDGLVDCGICGRLESDAGDPIFHPEQWL